MFQLDLDKQEHQQILTRYREAAREGAPIGVVIPPEQRDRHAGILHGLRVWTHTPAPGDLDALAGGWDEPAKVRLNDGTGAFGDSEQSLQSSLTLGVSLGDLDGDGDLDAVIPNGELWQESRGGFPNEVWLNEPPSALDDCRRQHQEWDASDSTQQSASLDRWRWVTRYRRRAEGQC